MFFLTRIDHDTFHICEIQHKCPNSNFLAVKCDIQAAQSNKSSSLATIQHDHNVLLYWLECLKKSASPKQTTSFKYPFNKLISKWDFRGLVHSRSSKNSGPPSKAGKYVARNDLHTALKIFRALAGHVMVENSTKVTFRKKASLWTYTGRTVKWSKIAYWMFCYALQWEVQPFGRPHLSVVRYGVVPFSSMYVVSRLLSGCFSSGGKRMTICKTIRLGKPQDGAFNKL